MSISRDVGSIVDQWMDQAGTPIKQRIRFVSVVGPGHNAMADSSQAIAAVCQIRNEILSVRTQNPGVVLHLFAAMPIALAVLLGHELNRCGPIQCYEYVNNTYQPSCLLQEPQQ